MLAITVLSIYGTVAAGSDAAPTSSGRTVRLLTIGNSFARNATDDLSRVAAAAGHRLILGAANVGGCTLERHWKAVEAFEAAPGGEAGRIYQWEGRSASLREMLTAMPWDFVTLQQASKSSIQEETFDPYASNLYNYVRKHAPQAEVLIHQTWAYRPDSDRLTAWGIDSEEMYRRLTRNYRRMAEVLGTRIIPVGAAFHRTLRHPDWQFRFPDPDFDYQNAVPPALPDQRHSLHVGWLWRAGRAGSPPRLGCDAHHASPAGKYLGAAVFFEVLFDESIIGNAHIPRGVSQEDALFLQQRAHETVATGEPLAESGGG